MSILYFANASAGNFTDDLTLNLPEVPLSMVWYLGSIDKEGTRIPGGGLIPGSSFDSGTVLSGAEIFSGASANYSCEKDKLTIKITSTNVGWAPMIEAHFYYMLFYDATTMQSIGL